MRTTARWAHATTCPPKRAEVNASALAQGFTASLALIVAIGAQNAFVLRMGLQRRHVGAVVTLCAASDAVLIALGVGGMGALVQSHPGWLAAARWGGAAFLAAYAGLALRRAISPQALQAAQATDLGLARTLASAAAFTFLNPHVYLDTVLLLGNLAQASAQPQVFALGAMAASALWFSALGWGARWLGPVLARPLAWRVLDAAIALGMASLAWGLLRDA